LVKTAFDREMFVTGNDDEQQQIEDLEDTEPAA